MPVVVLPMVFAFSTGAVSGLALRGDVDIAGVGLPGTVAEGTAVTPEPGEATA
jgi:hypothetical protein